MTANVQEKRTVLLTQGSSKLTKAEDNDGDVTFLVTGVDDWGRPYQFGCNSEKAGKRLFRLLESPDAD